MTMPPLRGKRGRDRHIAERIVREYGGRAAQAETVDLDRASAEADVEIARSAETRTRALGSTPARAGRRIPDLSALPPLLVETGSFEALRERLRKHAGLTSVPHGAKTYLVAALVAAGERIVWIARDAEIGDRVAEELGAWVGDPDAVAVLEPRTALPYERSELVADETAARVAALSSWRSGRARILVASVQALLQHTLRPEDLPAEPSRLAVGARIAQDALLRTLFDLGYVPVTEVAGRGEFARRGGIVDVFPPSAPLPVRIEFFGDEIDSIRTFDPTDQRSLGPSDGVSLLPATEFLRPEAGSAGRRARCRSASSAISSGSAAVATAGPSMSATPPRSGSAPRSLVGPRACPGRGGPRARRTGRHRRCRRVPVAPGRGATGRARRGRRVAEELAVDLPRPSRLEVPSARVADARDDLGIRATRGFGDGRPGPLVG